MVDFIDNRGESPAFQVPSEYAVSGGIAVPKAYAGHNARANYSFYTIDVKNEKKSKAAGYEVRDTVEIVEFKNDSKCSAAHRIDASIFELHPEILQDYQMWKQGKSSGITEVRNWDALTVSEMGTLISRGFVSVEQIHNSTDTELMILGLGWKDIKMKADQHIKMKERERAGIKEQAELTEVQKELAKRDAEIAELRAMIMGHAPKSDAPAVELVNPLEVSISEAKAEAKPKKRKAGLQA